MDILNPKFLGQQAGNALRRGREPKKVTYWYAGLTLAISVLITLADIWLESRIADTGGLGNLGTRAVFSTAQQAIPTLSMLVAMCLDLGYLYGLMRISRGQYADHTDLKMGFRKFWSLMRMNLLQGLVFFGLAFFAFQVSYFVFMLTPWMEPLMELLEPLVAAGGTVLDEAIITAATELMIPMFLMFGVVYLAVLIPFLYWFRMASYCLLDDGQGKALGALRASRKMMRRRFGAMLKIDLSLWPYYLVTVLTSFVLYADWILPLMGVELPFDTRTASYLFYGLALVVQLGNHLFLRSKAEMHYLLVYDRLREKPQDNGVVLGNIFDM